MTREIYNIASSGLLLAQRGLNTTSSNISSANVQGYSRQRLETSGIPEVLGGAEAANSGKASGYIQRFNDTFIQSRISSETSSLQSVDTYQRLASRIDSFIADPDTNLLVPMTDVFTAMQDIVADPTDSAARIDMLDRATVMAQRIGTLNDQLTTLQDQFDSEMVSDVNEVNLLARNIAELNSHIVDLNNKPNADPPNELLDKRDALLQKLSEKINVRTVGDDDGNLNVFVGYGQSLVSGDSHNSLVLESSPYDGRDSHLMLVTPGQPGATEITSSVSGGSIGGLQKFKREVLEPSITRFGQLAAGFALAFNARQREGIDLNGTAGQNIFTDYTDAANTVENWRADTVHNTGTATLEVTFDDAPDNDYGKLIPTDYELRYQGGEYTLTRLSDNKVLSTADETLKRAEDGVFRVDGIKIKVLDEASLGEGDGYRLKPFSRVADEFAVKVGDPAKLAAASQPSRDWSAADGNAGTATLEVGFSDAPDATIKNMVSSGYDLRYENPELSETGQYTITRLSDNRVFSTVDGSLTLADDGSLTVDGIKISLLGREGLVDGDSFSITAPDDDFGGIADNSNMLALSQLQTAGTLDNKTYSFHQVYTQMVTTIGGRTRTAEIDTQAHTTFLSQLTEQRENVSGVNLDEEASNLLKYQQAYQAAAQIIPIANSMFDALLSAVR